jgi:hypothetical protein
MDWNLQSIPETGMGEKIGKRLGIQVGQLFDSFMSVYKELYQKKFDSPSQLQEHFRDGEDALFTPSQAQNIYNRTSGVQLGGQVGRDSVINESVQKIIDMLSGIDVSGPPDPRVTQTLQAVQAFIRSSLPFVFTLSSLEQSPLFGDILASALDITAAALPVFASISQTQTPALVGLLPLPYASTVGLVAGWLISFFFLFIALLIGLSRKDFAAAVEATAGMIPVLGPVAMRTVTAVDKTATKLRNRVDKVYASVQKIYGNISKSLDTAQRISEGEIPSALSTVQTAGRRPFKTLKKSLYNIRKWKRTRRRSKKL